MINLIIVIVISILLYKEAFHIHRRKPKLNHGLRPCLHEGGVSLLEELL